MWFGKPRVTNQVDAPKKRAKPAAKKLAPELAAKARELRDRWVEYSADATRLPASGKYDVARQVGTLARHEAIDAAKLLAA